MARMPLLALLGPVAVAATLCADTKSAYKKAHCCPKDNATVVPKPISDLVWNNLWSSVDYKPNVLAATYRTGYYAAAGSLAADGVDEAAAASDGTVRVLHCETGYNAPKGGACLAAAQPLDSVRVFLPFSTGTAQFVDGTYKGSTIDYKTAYQVQMVVSGYADKTKKLAQDPYYHHIAPTYPDGAAAVYTFFRERASSALADTYKLCFLYPFFSYGSEPISVLEALNETYPGTVATQMMAYSSTMRNPEIDLSKNATIEWVNAQGCTHVYSHPWGPMSYDLIEVSKATVGLDHTAMGWWGTAQVEELGAEAAGLIVPSWINPGKGSWITANSKYQIQVLERVFSSVQDPTNATQLSSAFETLDVPATESNLECKLTKERRACSGEMMILQRTADGYELRETVAANAIVDEVLQQEMGEAMGEGSGSAAPPRRRRAPTPPRRRRAPTR